MRNETHAERNPHTHTYTHTHSLKPVLWPSWRRERAPPCPPPLLCCLRTEITYSYSSQARQTDYLPNEITTLSTISHFRGEQIIREKPSNPVLIHDSKNNKYKYRENTCKQISPFLLKQQPLRRKEISRDERIRTNLLPIRVDNKGIEPSYGRHNKQAKMKTNDISYGSYNKQVKRKLEQTNNWNKTSYSVFW